MDLPRLRCGLNFAFKKPGNLRKAYAILYVMPVHKKKLVLTSELLREIEVFSKHFLTLDEIAFNLGVTPDVFQKFCAKHKKAVDAVTSARVDAKKYVVSKLWEKVEAGNLNAIFFVLKTQFGFSESMDVNLGFSKAKMPKIIPKKLGADLHDALRVYQEVMK